MVVAEAVRRSRHCFFREGPSLSKGYELSNSLNETVNNAFKMTTFESALLLFTFNETHSRA